MSPSADPLDIQSLRGWHLPLLQDPAFLDLLPLLQRSLLLQGPERLLHSLAAWRPLVPEVLVGLRGSHTPLGLVLSQRLNRSGSCWQLQDLRIAAASLAAGEAGRMAVESALVREAIQRSREAASWMATSDSEDSERLAVLRQQGFQPLRREVLWRWRRPTPQPCLAEPPRELQLRGLNRRSAQAMWQLEQAAMPAQLRQLLDRSVEDLLDQSDQPSVMLIDTNRRQAVAGARRLRVSGQGPVEIELTVHPGWSQLLGEPLRLLLERSAADAEDLIVRSDVLDGERSTWLQGLGLTVEREVVVMARSVWRRHAPQPSQAMARRLESVLNQLQPRQRPIPTPAGR